MRKQRLASAAVVGAFSLQAAITLNLSPGGTDKNSGTTHEPVATLTRARVPVRSLKREGLYADSRRASPAVKSGGESAPTRSLHPRIPRPELKPRYVLETLTGRPFAADGTTDPKEWPTTRKPQLECMNEIAKAPSKYLTTARIGFDGIRLRFLITVNIDPKKPLKMDGKWGGRDGIELALSDTGEDAPVFLLHAYPDGTLALNSPSPGGAGLAEAARKVATCGARIDTDRFTVEIGLPVAAIGIRPKAFRELRFNLNVHRTCDGTWTCWWTPANCIGDLPSSGLLILPSAYLLKLE